MRPIISSGPASELCSLSFIVAILDVEFIGAFGQQPDVAGRPIEMFFLANREDVESTPAKFELNRAMWVQRILGDCPACGGIDTFGNVSVSQGLLLRGSETCSHSEHFSLPEIRKKIIYLDQYFFSNAFKGRDQRFIDAAQLVKEKTALQLLVAPYSSVHEDETHLWSGHSGDDSKGLMKFIDMASRGHRFSPTYKVEETQIVKAFSAFLNDETPFYSAQECDVIGGELHDWDGYIRASVMGYNKNIASRQTLKTQAVGQLIDAFDGWRNSKTTFDDDVAIEMRDAAKGYTEPYLIMLERLANGDYSAIIDSPVASGVCETMMYCFSNEIPASDRFKWIKSFFESPHFMNIPCEYISCRMFAEIKKIVKQGAYRNKEKAINRLNGLFQDIEFISVYAPYCDAIVVDKPMAELVSQLDLSSRYQVKIFSLNNWNDFTDWLSSLNDLISAEHRWGLDAAYGRTCASKNTL